MISEDFVSFCLDWTGPFLDSYKMDNCQKHQSLERGKDWKPDFLDHFFYKLCPYFFWQLYWRKGYAAIENDGRDYDRSIHPDIVQFNVSVVRVHKKKRVQNHSFWPTQFVTKETWELFYINSILVLIRALWLICQKLLYTF